MSKKAETQFALLASAFTADEKMARQVCSLLANGHIDEPVAKLMLALVRDGHLATMVDVRWNSYPVTYPAYPRWPIYPTVTWGNTNAGVGISQTAIGAGSSNTSLTAMARELVGSAA